MLTELNNVKTNFNNIHKKWLYPIYYSIYDDEWEVYLITRIKHILSASVDIIFFWMHIIICFLWR